MTETLAALVQSATIAAGRGAWAEAEAGWNRVLARAPRHHQALFSLGVHALQRNDFPLALERLAAAGKVAPADPMIPLTIAVAAGQMGDLDMQWQAIQATLAIDAYFLPGLLAKGAFEEQSGQGKASALTFANALKIAPPESHWPRELAPQLRHARQAVTANAAAFSAHLERQTEAAVAGLDPLVAGRWREAASIMTGRTAPYLSQSNQLHVPRLPAIPFYDRADFPWVAELEAQTNAIRAELMAVLAEQADEFVPYITYQPGDPVNQWQALNHSRRWSTYVLWRSGAPVAENLARCPQTAKALAAVEMADIGGLCPNVMFSALAPHTEIPPHHGETNARLVVHLPLVVPQGCSYRVGFEERKWTEGEVLIFDDTLEHTARNDSDQLRTVLIFDVWNPLLTKAEREMVGAMTSAARSHYAPG